MAADAPARRESVARATIHASDDAATAKLAIEMTMPDSPVR
jgi:hypothetical protein